MNCLEAPCGSGVHAAINPPALQATPFSKGGFAARTPLPHTFLSFFAQ